MSMPKFRTPRWRTLRTGAFVVLGSSSFIPLLHGTQLFGLKYMLQYSGMRWYLLELGCYLTGVIFYGVSFPVYCPFPLQLTTKDKYSDWQLQTRTPERLVPSRFDIWGSSHQIFHVAILCAIYLHTLALRQAFTACHTLDICKVQAAYRAGHM